MANNTYTVDYAPTAKAGCKYSQCKIKIEKGALRLGKSYPSDRFTDGGSGNEYFHPKCWFEAQKKTKKTTKKVESEDDLQGFDVIKAEDQKLILDLISHRNDPPLNSPKKEKKTDGGGKGTPKKQSNKQVCIDSDEENHQPVKNKSNNNTPTSNNNKNKPKVKSSDSDSDQSEDLEKDAWASVASNGSRVAKVLNSTDITQITVIILASASKDAIKRVSTQDDHAFNDEFGGDPDAYLQWLAGTGVLWISTDFDDAGFTTPGLWSDTSSQIVRQIFLQKPKKGLVVATWGPETKHFRNEVKKHYQDTMGTVKYRVLEGPTPLSSAFDTKEELSKIDNMRTLLSMHALHWWPFEGEVALKKEAAKNAGKKKSSDKVVGEGGVLWVLKLNEEDGGAEVELTGGPTELGRNLVNNKKISRKQCVVDTVDYGIELTPLGVNPMTMSRAGRNDVEILSRNEKYTLSEGDSFTLCGEQYRFVVCRPTPSQSTKTEREKGKAKQPVKQSSKIDAGEDEGEKTKKDDKLDHANGDSEHEEHKKDEEGGEEEVSPIKEPVKRKSSDISTTTTTTTTSSGKKTPQGSSENDSATVPFSASYDSPNENKATTKKKSSQESVKKKEPEDAVAEAVDDDAEIARKLQEQEDEAAKSKKTPKPKNKTPDKDEILARKLQEKFNSESGGGGKKKRKQEDEDDDGDVNWAATVKKKKKTKKGGSDDDDEWVGSGSGSVQGDESDEDYHEDNSDDNKPKKASPKKPPCMYGKSCYRTNPEHRKQFSHPK